MVVFVDLEDEAEPPEHLRQFPYHTNTSSSRGWSSFEHSVKGAGHTPYGGGNGNATGIASLVLALARGENGDEGRSSRENPNRNKMTEALGCYPITMSIASHIDLNTLDALSRTCRQIRVNLLQFRTQLLSSTLRCENEDVELDPEHTFRYRARAADWYFVEMGRESAGAGKVGDCARDMVAECRRCARVVCRNCTIKSPPPILLRHRHRRICKPCSKAPLTSLVPNYIPSSLNPTYLQDAICTCPTKGVWLCQPCGRSLRSSDQEYESIWKWRTRYLPSLGGLGVGIGEGDRGVPCGRGGECVAARELEQEIDCDAEDARESSDRGSRAGSPAASSVNSSHSHGQAFSHSYSGSLPHGHHHSTLGSSYGSNAIPFGSPGTPTGREDAGYMRHEIEGIGGVVKKKLMTVVRVGACVMEWGDEKAQGKYLVREYDGRSRSWCGWCWRVVPGVKDEVD